MSVEKPRIRREYPLEDSDHDLVKKYKPRFLAAGGLQAVYEIPDHPEIVVKANMGIMKTVLAYNKQHKLSPSGIDTNLTNYLRAEIEEERDRHGFIQEHFGRQHVLGYKKYIMEVPVPFMLAAELGRYTDAPIHTIWTIVMVQRRAREVEDPRHQMISSGYLETGRKIDRQAYDKVTWDLVLKSGHSDFDREEFLRVQKTKNLRNLLDAADKDPALKETLQEVVERSLQYVHDTDEILDLVGTDNFILFPKKGGGWDYLLVDALYPRAYAMGDIRHVMGKVLRGEELDEEKRTILLNGINFARTVNGLAAYLGIKDRIDISPPRVPKRRVNFLEVLQAA